MWCSEHFFQGWSWWFDRGNTADRSRAGYALAANCWSRFAGKPPFLWNWSPQRAQGRVEGAWDTVLTSRSPLLFLQNQHHRCLNNNACVCLRVGDPCPISYTPYCNDPLWGPNWSSKVNTTGEKLLGSNLLVEVLHSLLGGEEWEARCKTTAPPYCFCIALRFTAVTPCNKQRERLVDSSLRLLPGKNFPPHLQRLSELPHFHSHRPSWDWMKCRLNLFFFFLLFVTWPRLINRDGGVLHFWDISRELWAAITGPAVPLSVWCSEMLLCL